ncbi:hypothetical protein [Kozakia baliensis]|uniref:hypothetical protein n=1 Tax=Kozakia baliensis TaxID=153496 RepID=UPI00068C76FE|nr:hypothetical protein [Kozakia baliensis]
MFLQADFSRRPAPLIRHAVVAFFVLLGLLGQLAISADSRLGEMPRATLDRLVGIATTQVDDCGMAMPMAHHRRDHSHHGGQHDCCFLCPLLTLAPVILHILPVLPGPGLLLPQRRHSLFAARAPPETPPIAALPRGPPSSRSTEFA